LANVTVTFYDVSSPAALLTTDSAAGSQAGRGVFDDLGRGTGYASYTYGAGFWPPVTMPLNHAAQQAIMTAAGGGTFAIGGAADPGGPLPGGAYAFSGGAPAPVLTITTVPEPAAGGLILAAAATLSRARFRRR
jgi:hypothetical protein